eukprot:UC1_evm1s1149
MRVFSFSAAAVAVNVAILLLAVGGSAKKSPKINGATDRKRLETFTVTASGHAMCYGELYMPEDEASGVSLDLLSGYDSVEDSMLNTDNNAVKSPWGKIVSVAEK